MTTRDKITQLVSAIEQSIAQEEDHLNVLVTRITERPTFQVCYETDDIERVSWYFRAYHEFMEKLLGKIAQGESDQEVIASITEYITDYYARKAKQRPDFDLKLRHQQEQIAQYDAIQMLRSLTYGLVVDRTFEIKF